MGYFAVNVNVRSRDRSAVEQAVRELRVEAAWVTGSENGWITVYEQRASAQDDAWIREVTERLSAALQVPAIGFLVHDSDVVCYWLCDEGKLVDHFNSHPDYFEFNDPGPRTGRADVLVKYCADGIQLTDVQPILGNRDEPFAENTLARLAKLLDIGRPRALADFKDLGCVDPAPFDATFVGTKKPPAPGTGVRGPRLPMAGGETEEQYPDEPDAAPMFGSPAEQSAMAKQWLGFGGSMSDPVAEALVQAAAENNIAEINNLAAIGADLNLSAPATKWPGEPPLVAQQLANAGIALKVTPLIAAVLMGQHGAVRRLIELGADPNDSVAMCGTPLHASVTSGNASMMRVLLNAGANPSVRDAYGQTPLDALERRRLMPERLAQLEALGASMGSNLIEQFEKRMPPAAALDECERILRERLNRK
jgi:ankyrin repeat protein